MPSPSGILPQMPSASGLHSAPRAVHAHRDHLLWHKLLSARPTVTCSGCSRLRAHITWSCGCRSLLTQEGICMTLSPEFHFLEVAYPYVARRLLTDEDPALRERLFQVCRQTLRLVLTLS